MTPLETMIRHPYVMAGLGGAIGSVSRALMTDVVARWTGDRFPFGTMVVNVTGALIMGLIAGYGESEPGRLILTSPARAFLMIGILGGYTTFSSFSLQTFLLLEQGNVTGAVLNVLLSVTLCLAGVWVGFTMIRALT